jgi:hypothetical protein
MAAPSHTLGAVRDESTSWLTCISGATLRGLPRFGPDPAFPGDGFIFFSAGPTRGRDWLPRSSASSDSSASLLVNRLLHKARENMRYRRPHRRNNTCGAIDLNQACMIVTQLGD